MKMTGNGDCSKKRDWCAEENNEEYLSVTNQDRWGQKDESVQGNGVHYGQGKEKLEEELTRLALVMTENQCLLRKLLKDMQDADDELRLVLAIIRADLEKSNSESLFSGGVNKRSEMEQEIMINLTDLAEGQEEIKSKLSDQSQIEDLTKIVEAMALKQNDQERKPVLRCYWCHKESHFKRNCLQRINRGGMQSQEFRQHLRRINQGRQSQRT